MINMHCLITWSFYLRGHRLRCLSELKKDAEGRLKPLEQQGRVIAGCQ